MHGDVNGAALGEEGSCVPIFRVREVTVNVAVKVYESYILSIRWPLPSMCVNFNVHVIDFTVKVLP